MSKGFKQKQTYLGESRHMSVRKVHQREQRKKAVTKMFPVNEPFASREELDEYLSGDKIQCLICGREFPCQLGQHIRVHRMTRQEYKKKYNIPLSVGLVTKTFHNKKSANMKPEQIKHMKAINSLSSRKKSQPMQGWLKDEYSASLKSNRNKIIPKKGMEHSNSVLSDSDVAMIRREYKNKVGKYGAISGLAKIYKVSEGCIAGIVKNRTWRHIKI